MKQYPFTKRSNSKAEVFKGTRSIINYGSDQPLEISKTSIQIYPANEDYKNFYIQIKLFSRKGRDAHGLSDSYLCFRAIVKDKSTRCILERCISGEYAIGGSLMKYDRKKRMWQLNLVYDIPPTETDRKGHKVYLEKGKILGVFLDYTHPVCASVYGDSRKFIITPVEEVHHILPISKGGTHAEDNLMNLCQSCHNKIHHDLGDR